MSVATGHAYIKDMFQKELGQQDWQTNGVFLVSKLFWLPGNWWWGLFKWAKKIENWNWNSYNVIALYLFIKSLQYKESTPCDKLYPKCNVLVILKFSTVYLKPAQLLSFLFLVIVFTWKQTSLKHIRFKLPWNLSSYSLQLQSRVKVKCRLW